MKVTLSMQISLEKRIQVLDQGRREYVQPEHADRAVVAEKWHVERRMPESTP